MYDIQILNTYERESQFDFENISSSNSDIYSGENWNIYDKAISSISVEMVDEASLSQVNITNITIERFSHVL